ncbi:hypothetical protein Tco_0454108 [Tanacetum coccineum]
MLQNFLDKMPQEGLAIIESKSKVRYSRSRATASLEDKMTIKMKQMMNKMKALVFTTPAPVKAVEEERARQITLESDVSYEGPSILSLPPFVNPDMVEETSTDPVPPPLTQKVQETNSQTTTKVNQERYVNCPKTYELKLPYPERRNVEKRQDKDKVQLQKFWKMFKQLHFNISLAGCN